MIVEIINVISDQRTIVSPVNGLGGHHIYSPLYVLFYEESNFMEPHYQSIRPGQIPTISRPQQTVTTSVIEQVPVARSQLPSLN